MNKSEFEELELQVKQSDLPLKLYRKQLVNPVLQGL